MRLKATVSRTGKRAGAGSIVGKRVLIAMAASLSPLLPSSNAMAQVSGEVLIRGGHGSALVRNSTTAEIEVRVALWESDEPEQVDRAVQLLRPSRGQVWPPAFRLLPGETQTVRLRLADESYPPGTLLRMETRLVPVPPAADEDVPGVRARVIFATRILSKVWVR